MEISLETGMDRQLTESAAFFESQSLETRRFLFNQAGQIWKAVQKGAPYFIFQLPAGVNLSSSKGHTPGHRIPGFKRNQHVLNLSALIRQSRESSTASFTKRLEQMERENNPALRDSARLVRYATARHIVFNKLEGGVPANQPDQFYKPAWIFIQPWKLLAPSIDEGRKILHKMEKSFGYNQQYHPLGMLFYSKSLDETTSHIEHILPGSKGSRKKTLAPKRNQP
jgi:hypothetical protein